MDQRFDIYRNVHKGIRRMLGGLMAQAGALDPYDQAALEAFAARVATVQQLLEAHHHHEDEHLGPHLAKVAPALLADMEVQHPLLHTELAALGVAATDLVSKSDRLRGARAQAFYLALARFIAHYFEHIDKEERAYMPALQASYCDAELMAIEQALVGSIEPQLMAQFLREMLPAMSAQEREEFFLGLQFGAPPAVFDATLDLARNVLAREDAARIESRFAARLAAAHA